MRRKLIYIKRENLKTSLKKMSFSDNLIKDYCDGCITVVFLERFENWEDYRYAVQWEVYLPKSDKNCVMPEDCSEWRIMKGEEILMLMEDVLSIKYINKDKIQIEIATISPVAGIHNIKKMEDIFKIFFM